MVQQASANNYPYGQCTWWACQRFHDVAGVFVPWMGDAHSWNTLALAYGWSVTSTPVNGPAIICLQPGIQGAGLLGHVAYVEAVQNANTVVSSNMNWGDTRAEQLSVQSVTFHAGPGVNFISLPGSSTVASGSTIAATSTTSFDLSSLAGLFSFAGDPVRIVKVLMGMGFILLAILLLFEPEILQAVKVAVLA